jgi:hypothetical protein
MNSLILPLKLETPVTMEEELMCIAEKDQLVSLLKLLQKISRI